MKSFTYQIQDEIGLHARPAGLLVKEAQKYKSQLTIESAGKTADLTRLMAIMSLGVKHHQEVMVTATGEDEEEAIVSLEAFFRANV